MRNAPEPFQAHGCGIRVSLGNVSSSAQFERDRETLRRAGRQAGTWLRVHDVLQTKPIVSIKKVVELAGFSQPTAGKVLQALCEQGIVQEITGQRRFRLYSYAAYLQILNEGTELEP